MGLPIPLKIRPTMSSDTGSSRGRPVNRTLAFSKLMTQKREEFAQSHTTIVKDEYKIEDMMDVIRERCYSQEKIALQAIFSETKDMNEVITLFLATLELVKVQEVQVIQEENFGNIYLIGKRNE